MKWTRFPSVVIVSVGIIASGVVVYNRAHAESSPVGRPPGMTISDCHSGFAESGKYPQTGPSKDGYGWSCQAQIFCPAAQLGTKLRWYAVSPVGTVVNAATGAAVFHYNCIYDSPQNPLPPN